MSDRSTVQERLVSIDQATLTRLVRRSLGRQLVRIVDWNYHKIYGGASDTQDSGIVGVYRFIGSGDDRGEPVSWSLILKAFDGAQGNDNPYHCDYWKREPLFYQSELLKDHSGSLVAPTCFDVVEWDDGKCWVWLEDITDHLGTHWPLSRYSVAARHLGQLNGGYLAEKTLPNLPWLNNSRLNNWLELSESAIAKLPSVLDHPMIMRWLIEDSAERIVQLWKERRSYLDVLAKLPQTLCHHDAFRRNLFARKNAAGKEETIAIDWSYVGYGPVGAEIVASVAINVAFGEVDINQLQELDRAVFEGYLAGLQDAGWSGEPEVVRLGYAVSSALLWGLSIMWMALPLLTGGNLQSKVEFFRASSVENLIDRWAELQRYLLGLADEGRQLAHLVR